MYINVFMYTIDMHMYTCTVCACMIAVERTNRGSLWASCLSRWERGHVRDSLSWRGGGWALIWVNVLPFFPHLSCSCQPERGEGEGEEGEGEGEGRREEGGRKEVHLEREIGIRGRKGKVSRRWQGIGHTNMCVPCTVQYMYMYVYS